MVKFVMPCPDETGRRIMLQPIHGGQMAVLIGIDLLLKGGEGAASPIQPQGSDVLRKPAVLVPADADAAQAVGRIQTETDLAAFLP